MLLKKILQFCLGNRLIYRMNCNEKVVALTFDDGPNAQYTEKILDVLNVNEVKATFFLVGDQVEKNKVIAQRIVGQGHCIGSHTVDHRGFGLLSLSEKQIQIEKGIKVLKDSLGVSTRLFRPPQGCLSIGHILYCLKKGITTAMWSLDSMDYKLKDSNWIISRIKDQTIKNGDIILFHDDNKATLDALAVIIPYLQDKGFGFRTIEEMM
ncbi:MAG: hypothetical protein A2Y03_09725 [Omnitrophica WOR_2 bacterium GWF2_38_59]|nr:MAG: hypothetical protein A2Y03_09725 [Omnitrophica WOR_2 bacterium GWF2_38_59]OGX47537.1 MAG: hypothetical protein A2243_04530 [Omnitrophica WOR_2 bacterium RIFOXYA2_FULL_38_17]OGX58650.1 MAG: hypothetical protein A2306_10370 [Omnitrophica WOR_2 bacterium RIFOXYB2_FULL_38_16]HBG61912.1 polysaccharide deacetylase family protein [Candidatus Omnitrophota bacterium]